MTYTELFRDFLIKNRIKKLYEKFFYENPSVFALIKDDHNFKLSFKGNTLTQAIINKYGKRKKGFEFLQLKLFISWHQHNYYEFWEGMNRKWNKCVADAEERGLIDKKTKN